MTSSTWYKVVIGIAILALLPGIVGAALPLAVGIALVILALGIGIPEGWDLYKTRRMGTKGRSLDPRDMIAGQTKFDEEKR